MNKDIIKISTMALLADYSLSILIRNGIFKGKLFRILS
jgi:hypothetical protein